MGPERAARGAAAHDQRRRRLDRFVAADGGAARVVEPEAPVFVVLGDGTFGFHMAEFETAVRCNLPFVAMVGTDARWNAEYNLQVRDYGPNRTFGCELLPTRYDLVVAALGGHGELVQSAEECRRDRTLAGQRQAGVHQRDDREHSGAGGATLKRLIRRLGAPRRPAARRAPRIPPRP